MMVARPLGRGSRLDTVQILSHWHSIQCSDWRSMMNTLALSSTPTKRPSPRQFAICGVVSISLLAAASLALFSAEQAVGGGWLERAAIPGRMLLLVVAATLLLRWSGHTWRSVGLARPASLWRTAGLVLAGYLGAGLMFAVTTQLFLPWLGLAPQTPSLFSAVEGNLREYLYWLIPVAWGSAAIGEELVFRGFLQTRLEFALVGLRGTTAVALLLQAVIFGALHSYQGAGGA